MNTLPDGDKAIIDFLESNLKDQMRSCRVWITQFERHQDGPSVRALAFALGKVSGAYGALVAYMRDRDLSDESLKISEEWAEWFEKMHAISLVGVKEVS
jgi:hypothetical protein